ncbi:MAG: hypothetical protein JXB13_17040 [Phycisphaerae bacterium]|nr:hypothetical protein [Phycisphaerae bacterium]
MSRFDRNKAAELFRELEFYSLVQKLPGTGEPGETGSAGFRIESGPPPKREYHTVCDEESLDELMNRISNASSLAFDLETTSLDAISAGIVGIALSAAPGEASYIPVGHFGWVQTEQLPLNRVLERLKPVLEDDKLEKIAVIGNLISPW